MEEKIDFGDRLNVMLINIKRMVNKEEIAKIL